MDYGAAASRLARPVAEGDHVQGPASAVVTLVEYGDYQCRHTQSAHPVIKKLQKISGDWLRFSYRNFSQPDKYEFSMVAAQAAEAAGTQGMFWEMHDYLMQHPNFDEGMIMDYAEEIGLDVDTFEADLASNAYIQRVENDRSSGIESGVKDTPTFFINGVLYTGGINQDEMLQAIETIAEEVEEEP